jgi:hypothetical protein
MNTFLTVGALYALHSATVLNQTTDYWLGLTSNMKTEKAEIDMLIYNIAAVEFARKYICNVKNLKPASQELDNLI